MENPNVELDFCSAVFLAKRIKYTIDANANFALCTLSVLCFAAVLPHVLINVGYLPDLVPVLVIYHGSIYHLLGQHFKYIAR